MPAWDELVQPLRACAALRRWLLATRKRKIEIWKIKGRNVFSVGTETRIHRNSCEAEIVGNNCGKNKLLAV